MGVFGAGDSTTSNITLYEEVFSRMGTPTLHIDSIGLGDHRLIYNNSEILKRIEVELLKIGERISVDEIDAILVTETYTSDLNNLKPVFQQIKNIFGEFPS